MNVKAIETIYNGYRFRSRLEARWAVFFDTLGVKYEYEPEGFDLGESGWYLPDFWLPDYDAWIEIKPRRSSEDERTLELARRLAEMKPVIVFWGLPQPAWNGKVFCHDLTDSSGGSYENGIGWSWCDSCNVAALEISDEDSRWPNNRTLFTTALFESTWNGVKCDERNHPLIIFGRIQEAESRARKARFEHGETP